MKDVSDYKSAAISFGKITVSDSCEVMYVGVFYYNASIHSVEQILKLVRDDYIKKGYMAHTMYDVEESDLGKVMAASSHSDLVKYGYSADVAGLQTYGAQFDREETDTLH